jgi:uncharacterized cofD-like protein
MKRQKVVVFGGGTGIYPVVNALRQLPLDCSTIINASDSGGSSGRIRDEFGFAPVGDLRQSLAALADPQSQHWIRQLLLYRFDKGSGLTGHNLGNLILTALQDLTGNTTEALAIAANIFRIQGKVIPITETPSQLAVEYEDGRVVVGEAALDDAAATPHQHIVSAQLEPASLINPAAAQAIAAADYVIIGPGDYYGSLQSVLLAGGLREICSASKASYLYFVNIMTRPTQTKDMSASQHVAGIEASIGKKIDTIVMNADPIPEAVVSIYAQQEEHPVFDDLGADPRVIRTSLLAPIDSSFTNSNQTEQNRSLLRHDQDKVLSVVRSLYSLPT